MAKSNRAAVAGAALVFGWGVLGWGSLAAAGEPPVAGATDPDVAVDRCIDAAHEGQKLRDDGKLLAARDKFMVCAGEVCPSAVVQDCMRWHRQLVDKLPTIVPRPLDGNGKDLLGAKLRVDGRVVDVDGRGIELDPGKHRLTWTYQGLVKEETIVLREGEKDRRVDVVFGKPAGAVPKPVLPATPAPAVDDGVAVPVASWVLGGVGLVGGGLFAGFAASAKSEVDDMRASCAGHCPADRVDAAKRDLIIANVSLGLGLASLAAGLGVAITVNVAKKDGAARTPAAETAIVLGPGTLSLSSRF